MQNNDLNQDTINNIKNLVDNGNIQDAISQISPEMIENFSKMFSSNNGNSNNSTINSSNTNSNSYNSSTNSYNNINSNNNSSKSTSNLNFNSKSSSKQNTYDNFDFSKLDMNTILKMKSVMEKMNNKNDPRANLLYSLKPYLRDNKQAKLDQYVNLLNVSKIAEIFKNDKKDDNNA